ncbi:MAG TPA: hypothetical protein VKR06_29915, partial [Ktedonosporobacter sp.]|nr:hypothetical protein [Ktedonosporobacter sp.]
MQKYFISGLLGLVIAWMALGAALTLPGGHASAHPAHQTDRHIAHSMQGTGPGGSSGNGSGTG